MKSISIIKQSIQSKIQFTPYILFKILSFDSNFVNEFQNHLSKLWCMLRYKRNKISKVDQNLYKSKAFSMLLFIIVLSNTYRF